jgi:hypothetical protein
MIERRWLLYLTAVNFAIRQQGRSCGFDDHHVQKVTDNIPMNIAVAYRRVRP